MTAELGIPLWFSTVSTGAKTEQTKSTA